MTNLKSKIKNQKSKIPHRLVLWDIDGTLINSGGAGMEALKRAGRERFGIKEDFQDIEVAGRTDPGIVRQLLAKHNTPLSDQNIRSILHAYVDFLKLELPRRKGFVMPGVLELFERFQSRPNLVHGLLTGNIKRGAELKLSHYGLWKFFEFGAFADEHHDRNKLAMMAWEQARERIGTELLPHQVDVIGDTGHDIACGKAIGARTIAVATGSWSRTNLAKHEPDFLFDDLSEVDGVMATLDW